MFKEYDTIIQELADKIHYAENYFHKQNGKYFQSLPIGDKETTSAFTSLVKAPGEQKTIPTIEFTKDLPFEIEIHEHVNSDLGEGYTIFFRRVLDKKEYIKSIGQGIGYTKDWYEYVPLTLN